MAVPKRVLNAVSGSVESDWHQHANGGGWVHKTATVSESAAVHPSSIVGDGATVGDEATVGDWAKVGDGATVGDEAKVGDGTSWDTNPPQIQGSRHIITLCSLTQIAIGCHVHDISEWLGRYKAIGRAEGYTAEQIKEYGEHIQYLAKIAARLTAKKEVQ